MKIEVLPNGFTRTTYDNGEVWDLAPNPFEGSTMTSPQEKMTVKFEIFDFGTDTPNAPDSEKLIEMFKKYKEEPIVFGEDKPIPKLSRFNIPYFNKLEKFLEDYGFKPTRLPWRFEGDRYSIIQLEDSDGNEEVNPTIYGIDLKDHEERVYRGRLFDSTHAAYIFGMVAEHRYLTGKDDFPKLPIEPVKFVVYRTNDYDYNNPIKTALPGTEFESYEQERGKNSSNPYMETLNRCVKKFTTAQELIDYNRTLAVPLILEGETLEIYNDYRE